jgi:predicted dehydrogenase
MKKSKQASGSSDLNRREFIQNTASFSAMMALMGGVPLYAEETNSMTAATKYSTVSAPVDCAVVGCGVWGREILQTLSRLPNAPVVAVCDNYEAAFRRAKESAPNAETFTDFRKLLEKKEVQAVMVATPSHLHREIVEAALAAGKHVYCEAPLAANVEDAQAIARAAKAAVKVNFQSGLQMRSNPQRHFLLPFIRSGATGKNVMARSQWHKKQSLRRAAANPEREKAINWQISAVTSPGLMGELVIHQLDMIRWLLNTRPMAVSGWGSTLLWKDGRDVADTVQALFEFPDGVNYCADAALTTSFDSSYEILYGTDSTMMLRATSEEGAKAWLFKEVDSPLLGWEVYARKEQFYRETGIALVADASKLQKAQQQGAPPPPAVTSLQHVLAAFITNSVVVAKGVEDFTSNFGEDAEAMREYITGPTITKARRPAAGWQEGFEATVLALKANEAISKGQGHRILIEKQLFEI